MLLKLLSATSSIVASASDSVTSSSGAGTGGCFSKENLPTTLVLLALLGLFMVWSVFSRRSQMKKQQEIVDTRNAIQPGNKVKTIGGICGVVVEVCPEDNTFVLETGSERSGKSYMRFDKEAIYQTDAVPQPKVEEVAEQAATPVENEEAEELFDEANKPATEEVEGTEQAEESAEEGTEEVVEEEQPTDKDAE